MTAASPIHVRSATGQEEYLSWASFRRARRAGLAVATGIVRGEFCAACWGQGAIIEAIVWDDGQPIAWLPVVCDACGGRRV